jgi:hypothetical protein
MRERMGESAAPVCSDAGNALRTPALTPLATPQGVLALQRTAGNRAVCRMLGRRRLARYGSGAEQREMLELGGKTDERIHSVAGDWVWDEFDRTLTLFTTLDGPYKGKALRVTYKDASREALEAMDPKDRYTNYEELSVERAKALEWMRTAQGKYQETEASRKIRVGDKTSGQTLCNSNTGNYLTSVVGQSQGYRLLFGLDPLQIATGSKRAGAFHTIFSHPAGPKAGDIVSYGKVTENKKGGPREAEFGTTTHVGIFKSARPGPSGVIWTVVDGGQGTFVSRQETRERTRLLTKETLLVEMNKLNDKGRAVGKFKETMECAVLKSSLADAGQSAEDKLLRGWIDLDEFLGGESAATEKGAGNRVFVGGQPTAAPSAS